jgi:[lysine-biosynthesis-protein LysW]--L-2-aminoadipate ligase
MMRLGVLYSRVRVEEKMLFERLEKRGIEYDLLDDREIVFDLWDAGSLKQYDAILERCINHSRALYSLRMLEDFGIPCVNSYQVADTCGDKLKTTAALERHGVPSPRVKIAFTPESALAAIESMG